MFRDVTLGQYYPSTSFIHKMDSRVKILLNLLYLVGIFFIESFFGFGIVLCFLLLAIAASKIPLLSILKSIKGILFLLILTGLLNIFFFTPNESSKLLVDWWIFKIYDGGVIFAAKMTLRIVLLVTGASLLTLTTTPVDLTHGIESLLKPLSVIRFPVHEMALIMSLALSFIPSLIEETDRIIKAQKARGAAFDSGGLIARAKAFIPILVPLLVSSFRRADELALAMNSRCYEGAKKRTQMRVMRITWRDITGAIITILFFTAVFLLYSFMKNGGGIVLPPFMTY